MHVAARFRLQGSELPDLGDAHICGATAWANLSLPWLSWAREMYPWQRMMRDGRGGAGNVALWLLL